MIDKQVIILYLFTCEIIIRGILTKCFKVGYTTETFEKRINRSGYLKKYPTVDNPNSPYFGCRKMPMSEWCNNIEPIIIKEFSIGKSNNSKEFGETLEKFVHYGKWNNGYKQPEGTYPDGIMEMRVIENNNLEETIDRFNKAVHIFNKNVVPF